MNLSFAGCGFLGIYHVGVAVCFRQYAPHLLLDKISGASAGAIAACCLLCDMPLGDITSDVLRVAGEARTSILGPFSPSFNIQNILLEGLEKFLPEDAHIRVSGKLHISLTRVCDGKNVIVSKFDSREDLLQVLLASAFIPIFSGIFPPKYQGVRYMDGGLSDNLPTLDENTITVSPFCGESDICPRDDSSQLFHINVANTSIELSKQNIYRFARIMFPPKPEVLSNMCKQGFDDALRFLHRNNLINCTRCLSVQSTFVVSETLDESFEYDPECKECKVHRQEALLSNMPETVLTVFQGAIESANKGLINWVFKHRGMKILSVLSLPYTVPADIVYATYTKFNTNTKALFSKLTTANFVSMVGNSVETRSFQYRMMGNMTVQKQSYLGYDRSMIDDHRMLSAGPKMVDNLWDASRYVLEQLASILNRSGYRKDQHNSKINCKLAFTEYTGAKFYADPSHDGTAKNHVNMNFTLNLEDSDLAIQQKTGNKYSTTKKVLSRHPSLGALNCFECIGDDTFDTILQVTSHHEAVMAYYYTDENNKVNWTEIYDVTDTDCEPLHSDFERENNRHLQFDDEWDENTWQSQKQILAESNVYYDDDNSLADVSEISLEEILERDSVIFSDPESEWNGTVRVDIPDDSASCSPDLRPESDQPCLPPTRSYRIPSTRTTNM